MIALMSETGLSDGSGICERCGSVSDAAKQLRGFPSPAEIYVEGRLEIGRHLVRHPTATYYARMTGEGMLTSGIGDGDLLVIDRSEPVYGGCIVVVRVGEEMLVRKLKVDGSLRYLVNDCDEPVEMVGEQDYEIWGRVIHSIRKH